MMDTYVSIVDLEDTRDTIVDFVEEQQFEVEEATSTDLIWHWKIGFTDLIACNIVLYPHESGTIMIKTTPLLRDGKGGTEAALGENEYVINLDMSLEEQIKTVVLSSKDRVFSFYDVAKNLEKTLREGGFEGDINFGNPIKAAGELGFQYILLDKRKTETIESTVAISSTNRGIMVRARSHFLNELGEVISDTIWNKLVVKSEDPEWVLRKVYEIPQLIEAACEKRKYENPELKDETIVYKRLLKEPGCYGENVIALPLKPK